MNACILVVDDDPEIVGAIAITLEREGYRVLRAYDGMEDPVALPLQGDGDGPHDLRIVVHHQNARVHLDPSLS